MNEGKEGPQRPWQGLGWRGVLLAGATQVFLAVTRWLICAKDGGSVNLWLAVLVTCTAAASVVVILLKRRDDRSRSAR